MKKRFLLAAIAALAVWAGPAAAYEAGGVDIHGFISQGFLASSEYNYLTHNSTDGSFEYNEMGINFSKQLSDKLRIGAQFFARDLGDAANNKVTLDWAYGDYRFKDWLGLRAGRIKRPLGIYNEIRDFDMLRTSIVLPQGIYNDLYRDNGIALNGVGLYGNMGLGAAGDLDYQVLAGAVNSDPDSGVGKYTNDALFDFGGESGGNLDFDIAYTGMIRWQTPLSGLRLGYSVATADVVSPIVFTVTIPGVPLPIQVPASSESSTIIHIGSVEYAWKNLTLVAEYMAKNTDSVMTTQAGSSENSLDAESYYLSASYRFTDWFTLGAYYSVLYPDKDDKDGENLAIDHQAWEKDLAVSLRFDINEYWIVKVEGHAVDGTANVLSIDNENSDFSESDWYYGAVKFSFSF